MRPVGRTSDSIAIYFSWLGPELLVCCIFLRVSVSYSATGMSIVRQLTKSVESSFLIHRVGYYDLFVCP